MKPASLHWSLSQQHSPVHRNRCLTAPYVPERLEKQRTSTFLASRNLVQIGKHGFPETFTACQHDVFKSVTKVTETKNPFIVTYLYVTESFDHGSRSPVLTGIRICASRKAFCRGFQLSQNGSSLGAISRDASI